MDWQRFFHFSHVDFQRLVTRRMVILLVMAILLYQGTGILYDLVKLQLIRSRPMATAVERTKAAIAPVREAMDAYRIIPEKNLFGTTTNVVADKQVIAAQQQGIEQLIELKGTVAGEGQYGFAIVEEKGTRKQTLVKVGSIMSGAKIVQIKRNAVNFLVGDQVVTLHIVESKVEPSVPTSTPRTVPAAMPPGTTIMNRAEIDKELQDMGSLLRNALVRPYFTAGVPDGFIISNIRPGSLYQRMGIVNGDVIQEVNNRKIQSADDVMGLLNTIKGSSSFSVTINRRGNKEILNYQFQ